MIRDKIKEIVENIDKFEKDTNNNGDLFYDGFGLRLTISFYSEIGRKHIKITLQIEEKNDVLKTLFTGMFETDIYLTEDEESFIYEELELLEYFKKRGKVLLEKQDDLLNSITFKE